MKKTSPMEPNDIIEKLGLQEHPMCEGFYVETYRADESIEITYKNEVNKRKRNYSTAIYYLITQGQVATLHRIKQDKIFHFYAGDPVEILIIKDNGNYEKVILENNLLDNHRPQIIIPAGMWQGLKVLKGYTHGWSLLGVTVAPGFDFEDSETGKKEELLKMFPSIKELIYQYTS